MSEDSGYAGQMKVSDAAGSFNAQNFVISQLINKINTSTVVKVIKCTNNGGLSPVGFVDVEPMVNQVDGQGNPIPHGIIYGLPYTRIQGGANAIIIDPQVGDIGIAVFASRDISIIKANKAKSTPGSLRKYSMADGMYIGGLLNAAPQQYVQFEGAGITINSPQKITLTAPEIILNSENVEINASTSFTVNSPQSNFSGKITAAQDIETTGGDVKAGAITLKTHKTSGVTPGGGTSGVPVP